MTDCWALGRARPFLLLQHRLGPGNPGGVAWGGVAGGEWSGGRVSSSTYGPLGSWCRKELFHFHSWTVACIVSFQWMRHMLS
jgi:hypothetical protein